MEVIDPASTEPSDENGRAVFWFRWNESIVGNGEVIHSHVNRVFGQRASQAMLSNPRLSDFLGTEYSAWKLRLNATENPN
jgi:hypothetical protein